MVPDRDPPTEPSHRLPLHLAMVRIQVAHRLPLHLAMVRIQVTHRLPPAARFPGFLVGPPKERPTHYQVRCWPSCSLNHLLMIDRERPRKFLGALHSIRSTGDRLIQGLCAHTRRTLIARASRHWSKTEE